MANLKREFRWGLSVGGAVPQFLFSTQPCLLLEDTHLEFLQFGGRAWGAVPEDKALDQESGVLPWRPSFALDLLCDPKRNSQRL